VNKKSKLLREVRGGKVFYRKVLVDETPVPKKFAPAEPLAPNPSDSEQPIAELSIAEILAFEPSVPALPASDSSTSELSAYKSSQPALPTSKALVPKQPTHKASQTVNRKRSPRFKLHLPPPKQWLGPLAIAGLLGTTGLIVAAGWLSYQSLVNPDVSFWLNRYLPDSTPQPSGTEETAPRTLKQLESSLVSGGQTVGESITLNSMTDILIPVLSRNSDCADPCLPGISELRIYRSLQLPPPLKIFQGEPFFRLLNHQSIGGPRENEVIGAVVNPGDYAGSSRRLPLTRLSAVPEKLPTPGTWLQLSGILSNSDRTIVYGRTLYFDPDRARLQVMLNWNSPKGESPQWEGVESQTPMLIVDRSSGLEPDLKVYQLKTRQDGEVRLQQVSLNQPAFTDPQFADSLTLAGSGLWSPALVLLKQVRQQQRDRWSDAAEAQFQLIERHAQITQTQAQQPAASVSERVLAFLINGSWKAGLQAWQAQKASTPEIQTLLQSDAGNLRRRVETALQVNPYQPEVIAWSALIISAQQGKAAANKWLQRQATQSPGAIAPAQALLKQFNPPAAKKQSTPTPPPSQPSDSSSAAPIPEPLISPEVSPTVSPIPTPSPSPVLSPSPAPPPVPNPTSGASDSPMLPTEPNPSPVPSPTVSIP
jgi:hypothetical protein